MHFLIITLHIGYNILYVFMNLFDTGYTKAFQMYTRIYRQVNGLIISKIRIFSRSLFPSNKSPGNRLSAGNNRYTFPGPSLPDCLYNIRLHPQTAYEAVLLLNGILPYLHPLFSEICHFLSQVFVLYINFPFCLLIVHSLCF